MTLDELYGDGSLAEFSELVGGEVTEDPIEGGVRLRVSFEQGRAKLDCYPAEVVWQTLRSYSDEPIGLYDHLARVTPPFFRERGVKQYVCQSHSPESEAILRRRLSWEGDRSRLVTPV